MRTNILLNSYGAANSGGLWSAPWQLSPSTVGTITKTIVPGTFGTTAQRIEYTGVAGDTNKSIYFLQITPVGSFAAGEPAAASIDIKGSVTGATLKFGIAARTSGDSAIGAYNVATFTLTDTFQRIYVVVPSLPANTSRIRYAVFIQDGFDTGDTVDITVDAAQLEKSLNPSPYIWTKSAIRSAPSVSPLVATGVL